MNVILKNKDLSNGEVITPIIKEILEWNKNNDLILWPFHTEINDINKEIINAFGQMEFIDDLYKFVYFDSNNKYMKFAEKHGKYNIFISILYLEDILDPYVRIRDGNLGEVFSNYDRKVLIFECHQKSINYNKKGSIWNSTVKKLLKNKL